MNLNKLLIWLVDTVSEGGHSFRNLRDSIVQNSRCVDDIRFLMALKKSLEDGLVEIVFQTDDDQILKLDELASLAAINKFDEIVDENMRNKASHFVEITDLGWEFLRRNGLSGAR
jgi:hypothetical protein